MRSSVARRRVVMIDGADLVSRLAARVLENRDQFTDSQFASAVDSLELVNKIVYEMEVESDEEKSQA
jgi:hypothetical protein